MADGKMFRWYSDEDIAAIKAALIEAAVMTVLALDPHIYDEDTVRAAARVVREMLKPEVRDG